eukprot:UN15870
MCNNPLLQHKDQKYDRIHHHHYKLMNHHYSFQEIMVHNNLHPQKDNINCVHQQDNQHVCAPNLFQKIVHNNFLERHSYRLGQFLLVHLEVQKHRIHRS